MISVTDAQIQAYTQPLVGARLPATTLPGLLASHQLVIVHFLRHLGCLFCKHTVTDLHKLVASSKRFPPLYFVHQSPVEAGEQFFEQYFPGAAHIADPQRNLYKLFGILRMSPLQLLNPRMLAEGLRARSKGLTQKEVLGDEWLLSGTFLFQDGKLRWQHRAKHAADYPSWQKLTV